MTHPLSIQPAGWCDSPEEGEPDPEMQWRFLVRRYGEEEALEVWNREWADEFGEREE